MLLVVCCTNIAIGFKLKPKVFMIIGKMNSIMIINSIPYLSALTYFFIYLFLDQPKRIFEPSNGGIGSILNTANRMLKNIMFKKNVAKIPLSIFDGIKSDNFNKNAETTAKIKLAIIPAEATSIKSLFLFFKGIFTKLFLD